jgi:ABC-type amino acid transport substrate-binding protein
VRHWIKHAKLVYAETYEPALELVRSNNAEAFASIREILIQYSSQLPGSRLLQDSYQTNLAGIAVPKGNAGRLAYLAEFLENLKRSDEMHRLVNEGGLRGVEVACCS